MNRMYETHTYYMMALEPVHPGSRDMQLGRVDNTIARDMGTGEPKIPATSLAGVARAYTAMHYPEKFMRPVTRNGETIYISCAGRGSEAKEQVCGQRDCPVCITYGFSHPGRDFPSMVQFQDIQILFYPVSTMAGPVWIASSRTLRTLAEANILAHDDIDLRIADGSYQLQTAIGSGKLNIGWVLLDVTSTIPPLTPKGQTALLKNGVPATVLERLVAVPGSLFSHLVNNNLEVRTSNAIDHVTGTVLRGALFSYEALPRSTIFWTQVTYKNPSQFLLDEEPVDRTIEWVQHQVELGLKYLNPLGIGGMTNRGMGQIRVLNLQMEAEG
jgi:CRISPR-associated protein Cmr4